MSQTIPITRNEQAVLSAMLPGWDTGMDIARRAALSRELTLACLAQLHYKGFVWRMERASTVVWSRA